MNRRSPFISFLLTLLAFIVIEGVCLMLISNNGIVQRYKLMEGVRRTQAFFWKQGEDIRYYFSLKKTNENLVNDNIALTETIGKLRILSADIPSDSLMPEKMPNFTYTAATVVRNSTDRQHNYLIIDKGSVDGIEPDMGVITPKGIVGYVHSVGKHFSMVVSFLDVSQSVSAIIKSNETFGPLRWDGKHSDRAILHEIPLHTEINVGDTIVSSGYSTIYPPNIHIGTILSSHLVDGINYDVTVKLFEDYSSLHYVYIARNTYSEELSQLNKEGEELK